MRVDGPVERKNGSVLLFEAMGVHIPGADLYRVEDFHAQFHIIVQEGIKETAGVDAEPGHRMVFDGLEYTAWQGLTNLR